MYSNILDSVRMANDDQLIAVEAFLIRSALSGTPAVLSPNQALDSTPIQLITEGNIHNSKNHFISAVKLGIVKIALPLGCHSLIEYCIGALRRGEDDRRNEYIFSSLDFLYEKVDNKEIFCYEQRAEVLNYILTELNEAKLKNKTAVMPSFLDDEQQEIVKRYISTITKLNDAVEYYESFQARKELLPQLIKESIINRLKLTEPKTEISTFYTLILKTAQEASWPRYRSYYYQLCSKFKQDFSAKTMDEFKAIVDICYNKVSALSLNENAELNIAPDYSELVFMEASSSSADHSEITSVIDRETTDCLDWEGLVEIYTEVDTLCREKGKTWREALEIYYARQSRLPFTIGGKYALITSLTMAVSAIPVVGAFTNGIVSEFMWNVICDASGDIVKKPSVQEILELSKKAKRNTDMMDIIVRSNR